MTTLCGGGSSSAKTGTAAIIDYTSGLVAELLQNVGSPWLIPVIPLLALPPLALSAFCATDPPAMTALSSDEANAVLQFQLGTVDFANGVSKLTAIIENGAWTQFCQCNAGAQPTIAAPAQPSGTPTYTPPTAPSCTACFVGFASPQITLTGTQSFGLRDQIPVSPDPPVWTSKNVTSLYLQVTQSINTSPGVGVKYDVVQTASDNSTVHTDSITVPAGTTTQTMLVPAILPAVKASVTVTAQGGAGIENVHPLLSAYCDDCNPGGVQSACCPPDPRTQATLDAILNLLTLTQRQIAPFAYLTTETDTGLSGSGSIGVQGILGFSVTVTARPSFVGVEAGTPTTLFDAGWVRWCTADGCAPRMFVDTSPFLVMDPTLALATSIDYSFPPGVISTIKLFQREA